MTRKMRKGFTLIELLIVVAIIAILAAIAVPNFLEAQVRAKVSRAKSDMRAVGVGIQAYAVDASKYPPATQYPTPWFGNLFIKGRGGLQVDFYNTRLTTPIAYMTSLPADPFTILHAQYEDMGYWYINLTAAIVQENPYGELSLARRQEVLRSGSPSVHVNGPGSPYRCTHYMLGSAGPSKTYGAYQAFTRYLKCTQAYVSDAAPPAMEGGYDTTGYYEYDPSNGTASKGVIYYME